MMSSSTLPLSCARKLNSLVARDRGGRGVSNLCRPEYWQRSSEALCGLESVAIVSGFFIPGPDAPETDGPGGAVILARAFLREGRESEIWTDRLCLDVMRRCAEATGYPCERVRCVDPLNPGVLPAGIVYTERLGRAADGCYYNFRKIDISRWTPPLDGIAEEAARRGVVTVGIGDGGNEVGMGNFYDELCALLPAYKDCLCVVKTDHALAADVSNWGAYALAAALSQLWGVWRGAEIEDEAVMLKALASAGAVDGISRLAEPTVDGFDIVAQNKILSSLKETWREYTA